MKKIILSIAVLALGIILVACDNVETSPIVISKLYTSPDQGNNIIELYNPTEGVIDLSKHAINFYSNGATEVSQNITLNGTVEANSYYVVGSKDHLDAEVKALFDFTYEAGALPYNGNDVIELTISGYAVDIVGVIGSDFTFSQNLTLIRLGEVTSFKPSLEYDRHDFIGYLPELYQYLKNDDYEIKTLEQLLDGPRLEDRYINELPYVNPNNSTSGAGGAVIVTNNSVADGDTAFFSASNGFAGGSVRYFYLNTPEVNGSNVSAEPWGYVASKYNKEYLLKDPHTKEIRIQSIPNYSLTEGYGRSLGLVWINGYLSQFLIVREGLSEDVPLTYQAYDLLLSYKNIPYLTFLKFAEYEAKVQGWATKGYPNNPEGEKSPDWNYSANNGVGGLATTNPVWQPHLELPWA